MHRCGGALVDACVAPARLPRARVLPLSTLLRRRRRQLHGDCSAATTIPVTPSRPQQRCCCHCCCQCVSHHGPLCGCLAGSGGGWCRQRLRVGTELQSWQEEDCRSVGTRRAWRGWPAVTLTTREAEAGMPPRLALGRPWRSVPARVCAVPHAAPPSLCSPLGPHRQAKPSSLCCCQQMEKAACVREQRSLCFVPQQHTDAGDRKARWRQEAGQGARMSIGLPAFNRVAQAPLVPNTGRPRTDGNATHPAGGRHAPCVGCCSAPPCHRHLAVPSAPRLDPCLSPLHPHQDAMGCCPAAGCIAQGSLVLVLLEIHVGATPTLPARVCTSHAGIVPTWSVEGSGAVVNDTTQSSEAFLAVAHCNKWKQ